MSLVGLLIGILVFGLLYALVELFPVPAPFKTIALAVVILIAILWLLGVVPMPLRLR